MNAPSHDTVENLLIVTDLDGTLLDDTYPVVEAARALRQVLSIPGNRIVLASSKTLPEMLVLADLVDDPLILIFENGAGIAWPNGTLRTPADHTINHLQVLSNALPYENVLQKLEVLRHEGFRFRGFNDMSTEDVSAETKLGPLFAALARQRLYSEPLQWLDTEASLAAFTARLQDLGLTIQLGGRFHHVNSGATKGQALERLLGILDLQGPCPRVLACGDAPNDLDMMAHADEVLLFPKRGGGYLKPACDQVHHAPTAGPEAWLAGVQRQLRTQGVSA